MAVVLLLIPGFPIGTHEVLTFPAGGQPFPSARLEEMVFVLEELASLTIHPDAASVLPLHPHLRNALKTDGNHYVRVHLLVLHPSLCELVISR